MYRMQICRLSVFFIPFVFFACESAEARIKKATAASAASKDETAALKPDGLTLFRRNCVVCHGVDGKLGLNGAKDLSVSIRPLPERLEIIAHGKNLMTPFGAILSKEEIQAVAEYTISLKQANQSPAIVK